MPSMDCWPAYLKQRTVLGQYLDPMADKLLLSTLFLVLMHKGLMPTPSRYWFWAATSASCWSRRFFMRPSGGGSFGPSIFGKANTVAQVMAVAVVLLHQLTPAKWVAILRLVALDATLIDGGFRPSLCLDRIASHHRSKAADRLQR